MYSGSQLKGLNRYNQDFASNEFMNAFNRHRANRDDTFNMLSGISGTGQKATDSVAYQGMQTAGSIGNNLMGAGNVRASSYLAGSNALTNALNQGVAAYGYYKTQPTTNPGYGQFTPDAGFGWMSGAGRLGD